MTNMKEFNHFDLGERKRIERYKRQGKSLRAMAKILDRSVSSISDEIRNNKVHGVYNAKKANHKALVKREQSKRDCLKVAMDKELQKFVIDNIIEHQSPGGISGRLKNIEKSISYASTKAIYKFVESPHGRQIEKHLYSRAVKKKTGKKRGTPVNIDGRISIEKRPKYVNRRIEFGHFEGDFIESGGDSTGSLLVLAERKTRYPLLAYLEDRTNNNVNRIVGELLKDIPVKSLTIDNDISFQKHEELSKLLNTTIYFCHPQAPYEKGTIENRNKAIRRYVKKKSDLSSFPLSHFKMVEDKLRNKYMKCLDYKTPKEMFEIEMNKSKQKNPQYCGIIRDRLLTS
jgi:transposase, IS30 family